MKCLIIIIFVMNHSVMTEQLLRFNYYWWQHDFSCNLVLISTSKFFKGNKIAHAERASAIYSLWKNLQELIYAKLHKNSCCYLSIIYTKFMMEKNWQHAVTICNFSCVTTLHSCYNFAPILHKNALVFSQSDAWNFFMYDNKRIKTFMMMDVFARNLQQENNTDISIHNVLTIPVESFVKMITTKYLAFLVFTVTFSLTV